ncbi:helix-turn-helix domain-containing protein [Actinoplanes aureus]|uniref:AraC family transcriptional regulator n=1 Tax=Actinoplanes aureus TaxID=2792083 RepID=A0A931C981_9ACTN|nr:helix-turn-helix domain-containing protein [Actinoplanes aureus]MBG0563062.1 AraC family transcriptional regulator [Actinoplanes aureus]
MYTEWPSSLPHVIAWRSVTQPGDGVRRILPDGCLDLIWHDGSVFVAGPDTTAQVGAPVPGSRHHALRFGAGTGPGVLGVPASELLDRQVPLEQIWPATEVRRIAEAADPDAALAAAATRRWHRPDPVMVAVSAGARADRPVSEIAEETGLGERQLRRRSVAAYGYGPKTLHRIFRMRRAVALARAGRAFAEVAADAGYADQAHLSRDVRALAGVPLRDLVVQPASGA